MKTYIYKRSKKKKASFKIKIRFLKDMIFVEFLTLYYIKKIFTKRAFSRNQNLEFLIFENLQSTQMFIQFNCRPSDDKAT